MTVTLKGDKIFYTCIMSESAPVRAGARAQRGTMNYKQLLTESPERVVGLKQVLKGIANGSVRCVVIASDSESFVRDCVVEAIGAKCVEIAFCPTRKELGEAVRVDVPTAVVGLK